MKKIMDGNEAASYVSYNFTEVAGIYPITPASPMAELTDKWSSEGKLNYFGTPVRIVEMESEAGAYGLLESFDLNLNVFVPSAKPLIEYFFDSTSSL